MFAKKPFGIIDIVLYISTTNQNKQQVKKYLFLLPLFVVGCQSSPELYVYNFASKNEWDDYSYAGHGFLTEQPIQSPYKFLRCYVDFLRTQDDPWSKRHVERYDADTNSCYIHSEGTWIPTSDYVTRDYCDIRISSPTDPIVVHGDTTLISDVDYQMLRRFHKPRD